MTITQLAEYITKHYPKFYITATDLRRWEAQGKIPKATRSKGNWRVYEDKDLPFLVEKILCARLDITNLEGIKL